MAHRKVYKFDEVFDTMTYPAGEPHIRAKRDTEEREILAELRMLTPFFKPFIISEAHDWNGIMKVVIANEILHDNGIGATFVIPYFPFARHDRRNDAQDSSPVPWVLQLLQNVDAVTIDPHSDVSGVLPHYAQSEVVREFAEQGIFENDPVIVIPDAGASKKAYSWIPKGMDYVQALKTRDVKTGTLSGFQVIDSENVFNKGNGLRRNAVIIDDICDGGGTFLGLADELLAAGALSIRLGVTHGLFTKGLAPLHAKFSRIYTLDTCTVEPEIGGILHKVSTEKIITEGEYF